VYRRWHVGEGSFPNFGKRVNGPVVCIGRGPVGKVDRVRPGSGGKAITRLYGLARVGRGTQGVWSQPQPGGDLYGGVLRGRELPQSLAIGGRGRTDIENPLGPHQGGLRNTLCNCLLMNHPVRLRSRGEEVLQERPGLAVEVIPVIDLGCCLGHKLGVLLAGIIETLAVLWVRGYQVRR
jgi:hypothetical protein